ncbi:MAG TPA: TIM44-like domain-containing protein [Geminicoccus sp.]|uniref:Tim44 domain-containing protein n=1 Tax=Geminicoccus sp. TaxID=2024832 RepID=UPI002E2F6EB1|nr:TIM44-like domain-containing protein [Geminicoccus sp.]HEX2527992.1 TIM44-like domain-containing protein [Geminicoccus sp.]
MTRTRRSIRWPRAFAAIALALVLGLGAGMAEARKGGSFGSRGARTYQSAPATPTAPNRAQTIDRSTTPMQQQAAPGLNTAAQQRGGFFSRGGFMPGLMGGLLGAGLFGMLFGGGFFGGLGSLAGLLGFVLQVLLVVFIVRLALRYFRSRSAPAYAGAGAPLNRDAMQGPGGRTYGSGRASANPKVRDTIGINTVDYGAFENGLKTIQTAYGQEDLDTLRQSTTPEMFGYFQQELADNAASGRLNKLSDVKLVQGDLAEAWREGENDYATVAMRYSLVDYYVDRATGQVVDGNPSAPVEVVELWTFTRQRGGNWLLSAIQQAS